MSKQVLESKCPGCGENISVNVDVPDPTQTIKLVPQEVVREVIKEDTAKVSKLTEDLDKAHQTLEALQWEVQKWQNGENHLTAADMLDLLTSCPNCKPTLDAFLGEVKKQAVEALTPDQVKHIAKAQKWWPPPPIELVPAKRKGTL